MSHGKWGQENRTWGNMGALIMGHGKIWGRPKEDMEKTAHGQDLAQDQVKDQVQGLVLDLEPDIVFNEDHGI